MAASVTEPVTWIDTTAEHLFVVNGHGANAGIGLEMYDLEGRHAGRAPSVRASVQGAACSADGKTAYLRCDNRLVVDLPGRVVSTPVVQARPDESCRLYRHALRT